MRMPRREDSLKVVGDATAAAGGSLARGIVISSRIRLARNLHGVAFPGWAGGRERRRVFEHLSKLLMEEPLLDRPVSVLVDALDAIDRDVLIERHLISPELAAGGAGSGVVYDRQAQLSAMINEEDHLRLQVLQPGLELRRAWAALDRLDTGLERHLTYAFSPTLGYLTACPSNVGTGMRASVMMHLSGLRLTGEAEQVVQGLSRTGFAVRGAFGEGSDAFGGLYQVSNQTTLGVSEADTLARLEDMVRTLVQLERHARQRLLELPEPRLADHVGRVFGVFSYARLLSAGEAMDIIAGLRLGLEFDMVSGTDESRLEDAMLRIQPGHLQREAKRVLTAAERDVFRAGYIRRVLTGVEKTGDYEQFQ
jgi:protein arginine kinase